MDTNSKTTNLRANSMVSFFAQCNIFVDILYIGPACLQRHKWQFMDLSTMNYLHIIIPHILVLLFKSNKSIWMFYGKPADGEDNPADNQNIYFFFIKLKTTIGCCPVYNPEQPEVC